MTAIRRDPPRRETLAPELAPDRPALTLLGAALRLPTLDRQSFWLDELVTASLLDHGLGDVLREVPRTEATPFVYYVVA